MSDYWGEKLPRQFKCIKYSLFHSKNVKKTLLNHLLKPHKPITTQKRKKLLDILFFIE